MEKEIIIVFCICDEITQALKIVEDPQVKMTNSEIMTTALVSMLYFSGNFEKGRNFLAEHGYIKKMLSKSRFNRRIRAIGESVWLSLFHLFAETSKRNNLRDYIIDSFPIPVCDNIRISRCKIYNTQDHRGYIASKRRYFFGLRVHMLVTKTGLPVEFLLAPGGCNDCRVLKQFQLDIPENSFVFADKSYNDYSFEDIVSEALNVSILPQRKKNSKRAFSGATEFIQKVTRKRIDTTFSQITSFFPKKIHAVTSYGFELKVVLFVLAFTFSCYF